MLLSAMFARMESAWHDDLISSIAPDVMKCLGRGNFSSPSQGCDGTYKLSESIFLVSGFERDDLDDKFFAVLQSKGGCCDYEALHNVAETSRLKATYWRGRAAGQIAETPHTPHSRPN